MGAAKNSNTRERFIGIPYSMANSLQFARLKAPEVKLLIDLLLQYNGHNNGNLSPCHALMRKRGWATSSLYRAYSRLEHSGFIVVTRQGWKVRGRPTLVAITWNEINEPIKCQFDERIKPSTIPLNYWCKPQSKWKHKPQTKKN